VRVCSLLQVFFPLSMFVASVDEVGGGRELEVSFSGGCEFSVVCEDGMRTATRKSSRTASIRWTQYPVLSLWAPSRVINFDIVVGARRS